MGYNINNSHVALLCAANRVNGGFSPPTIET